MITRRDWLRIAGLAAPALTLACREGGSDAETVEVASTAEHASTTVQGPVMTRPIPSSGEELPVIGLGGRWISANSTDAELADHREVLHELARDAEGAGRLFDSAAG
ncbi:MAG: hypothetical protein HKN73_05725, partial [Gemmatimonadetes bacterium]|nr:hypothetical protein [Gemmatimonadota bacterium]